MGPFLIAGALLVVGVVVCSFYRGYADWPTIIGMASIGIGVLLLVIMTIAAGTSKAGVVGELASAAQLRSAAARVNLQSSEDVMGKVTDFNQALATMKWQNQQWWGDPFIPDEWDTVSFIPVEAK